MLAQLSDRGPFAPSFEVGGWRVDPSLDLVSRDGRTLRLRPQLMDLLVMLARHAGQTVSKELILSEVWKGQFVAESGLTRCIAELRQSLGDNAHDPTLIQTIPKRGYRLVASVSVDSDTGRSDTTDACAPVTPAAAADAASPDPGRATASAWTIGRLPRSYRWTAGSAAVGVALFALTWAGIGWSREPQPAGRTTVLLADVANTTGDAVFDSTLKLALAVHLGQAPFLRVLPDTHVRAAAGRAGRPADAPVSGAAALDLCRRENAAVLLAASIARLGTHYAVGIQAIACPTGDVVGQDLREVARKEDVLAALGASAQRLRQTLAGRAWVTSGRSTGTI